MKRRLSSVFPSKTNKKLGSFTLDHQGEKKSDTFSICACHPCAGAMLIFSVSFQFLRMTPISRSSGYHNILNSHIYMWKIFQSAHATQTTKKKDVKTWLVNHGSFHHHRSLFCVNCHTCTLVSYLCKKHRNDTIVAMFEIRIIVE